MGDRVFQRYRPPVTGALPAIAQMVPGYLENPPGEIRTVSPVVQVPVKLEKGLLHGVLGIGRACTSAHQVTAKWTAQFLEPVQKLPARLSRSLHFVAIRHYPKSIRTTIQQANLLRDKAKEFYFFRGVCGSLMRSNGAGKVGSRTRPTGCPWLTEDFIKEASRVTVRAGEASSAELRAITRGRL